MEKQTVREYRNLIDGKWLRAQSAETFENRNPADWSEVVGVFPKSGREDVAAAVAAAREALPRWQKMPAPARGEIILRATERLMARKEELSRLQTREMGKVLKETRGDVQEAIDTGLYAVGESRRLFGQTVPSELPDKLCITFRQPVGVCGLITPWNFPMAIPSWKVFPALVAGNTAVFKPASDTPASSAMLAEALVEAGLPAGVLNVVFGGGDVVGDAILDSPDIALVSFTGSSEVGRNIAEVAGRSLKRCSLELGGKNAQIIMDDAQLDLAIEGALWGAFGTTGQRCTATSRLIIHEAVHDEVVLRLVERAEALRLGNGLDTNVDMGPLVNERQLQRVDRYVQIGKEEGAKLVTGGGRDTRGDRTKGWFYRPTIFTEVTPGMRIAQEEIFGPVLSVIRVASLEEAVRVLNGTDYGLSASIYTQNVNRALQAARDVESGITYINSPTIGAEAHLPFGGVKNSGNGHREGGWTVYDIFTEHKTVFVDYSGKLQKAQIDVGMPE